MRYILIVFLGLGACVSWAAEEPEIVIELSGPRTAAKQRSEINIWDKDAKALEKALRGKTREEALRQITSVSTKDALLKSADGTRYAFVQYGRGDNYRKCLFEGQAPQKFIACAANAEETLRLSTNYKVDMGLSEKDFLATYALDALPVPLPTPNGQTLYQLSQKNSPERFFLFDKKQFSRQLSGPEVTQLLSTQQQALEHPYPPKLPPPPPKPRTFKALIDGGTLYDQMYMPHVTNGEHLPHLIPSKIPAGTPLWPQAVWEPQTYHDPNYDKI